MTRFASPRPHRTLTGALALALAAAGGPLGAVEMAAPKAGEKHEYSCKGNNGNKVELVYKAFENDVMLYEASVDGRFLYRMTKPRWLVGTSLYLERKNRHGLSRMVSGLDSFDGLKALKVGDDFSGAVVEHRDTGEETTADFAIKVTEERTYETKATGAVKVYVIESTWSSRDRKFSGKAFVSPERGTMVHWQYKTSDGKEEDCDLVAITKS
jgi:hypothetical protein